MSQLSRDQTLFGDRPINVGHLLPETTIRKDMNPVVEHFESLVNERDGERQKMVVGGMAPEIIKALDANSFEERLKMLESSRSQVSMIPIPQPSEHVERQSVRYVEPIARVSAPLDQDPSNQAYLDRNVLLSEMMAKETTVHPKEILLATPATTTSTTSTTSDSNTKAVCNPNDTLCIPPPFPTQTRITERYILVDSKDRDWIAQPMRYRYKVKFNYSSQSVKKIPIYQNSPVIPSTISNISNGYPNAYGYYDKNGVYHDKYDPMLPPGDIIDYQEVVIPVDTDANIQTNFKNIYSIQVSRVIVPIDIESSDNSFQVASKNFFINNYNLNFPYVMLHIDEFNDIYEGTDDTIRKAFCQLVFKKTFQSGNGRGYAILEPCQDEKKRFAPSLLSSMPAMNISIVTPNGELFNKSRDGHLIKRIEIAGAITYKFKVTTLTKFDRNDYYVGDYIVIKNFALFVIPYRKPEDFQSNPLIYDQLDKNQMLKRTQNYPDTPPELLLSQADMNANTAFNQTVFAWVMRFNEFINRKEGHRITEIGDNINSSIPLYDNFFIDIMGAFNMTSGEFIRDLLSYSVNSQIDVTGDVLARFNANVNDTYPSLTEQEKSSGYIMNMSLQNSIAFKIEQVVSETPVFSSGPI